MSCSSVDLKAYVLGEIDRPGQAACETHLAACQTCREELEQLTLTRTALLSMVDEEIPQRIAFVSDKVFEPKWWQTIWRSGPAMVFASAALLSSAIFVHAYTRPAPGTAPVVQSDATQLHRQIQQEVDQRVQAAVLRAVAAAELRQAAKSEKILAAAEQRYEFQRRADLVSWQETINLYKNQMGRMMMAANYGSPKSE